MKIFKSMLRQWTAIKPLHQTKPFSLSVFLCVINMFLLFGIILICNTFLYVVLEKTEIPLSGQLVRFSTKFPGNVSSGILEVTLPIWSRYQYGHVCGRRFSLREADVVCKQLGFTRGALSTVFESTTSYDRRPTFEVKCDGRALTLQDCEIRLKVNCPDLNLAGVVCHENHGCPDGWTAGPTGCYEIPESMVTRRSYAITKCLKRSGHLVTIETEQENHFISNAFRNEEAGFILTGGLKKGSRWFWESVTSDAPSGNGTREPSSQTTKEMSQIEYTKWFPGWVPGGIEAAPSGDKQSGCLFLSSVYKDPLGSTTDVEYMFWMDDTCSSTRKRMSSGFRFMCERPFEQSKTDVGCYRGTGTDYRGRASVTQSGARCMKWTDAQGITPNTYPKMGLGDHNYCRNPDNDEAPWCWVSDGVFDFCDIPECVHEGQDNYPEDGLATVCQENEFTCNDYTCIPAYWQCDMEIDCSRGEDENQSCEYDLGEFVLRTGMTVRDHLIEVYAGATNETCADYCLNATRFVCRSFSFKPRTRECILSDVNSLTTELRASSSEDTFELRIQLAGCDGMFECDNGRCVKRKQLCDGHDHCGDFSDETGCDDQGDGGVTVRLIDGASRHEGRVQVFYKGEWGGICDDAWDDDDAAVVCRMLGYTGPAKALKRPLLADISAPILLDDVACIGSEDSLVECSHNGWKVHDCFFWEMAGVRCSNASVRLEMDRVNPYGGRVFVTRDGVEGTVCDDLWGDADAKVVCRMLGYSGGKVLDGNWFSPSDVDIPILLDDVQCTGNETTIGDCRHAGWGEHNCGHAEDAGVQCLPPITQGDDVTSEDNDSDDSDDVTTKVTTAKTTTKTTSKTTATAAKTTASAVKTTATAAKTTPAPSTKFTQKPAVGKPIVGSRDCLNDTMPYIGKVSHTEKGFHCQAWSSDSPHAHKYHGGSMFPDGTVEAADNFCRSPDNDTQPWCYTTDPETRWDYCSVPKCKRNCYTVASEYTGNTSQTTSGKACQRWSLDIPHRHKYHENRAFPDATVEDAANYCRAPDGDDQPWCYTVDMQKRWEYCDAPRCQGGSFNFNISCGIRPLETSRRRRRDVSRYAPVRDEMNDDDDELSEVDLDSSLYRKRGRVYGGQDATYGMFPWQARIRRRLSTLTSYHMHHCGATIVGEYWVLSAAHCFRDLISSSVVVMTGDHNSGYKDKYEQEFNVLRILPHPRYSDSNYDNDIALLQLSPNNGHGITFNDYVQPACLPNDTVSYRWQQKCIISGWGQTADELISEHLQAARVPLVDDVTCQRLYKYTTTPRMVCAGYMIGGVDSCAGDSGGPLVCDVNGHYTVMGVTSFGGGCAAPNAPGVYARVTSFMPWIREMLQKYS